MKKNQDRGYEDLSLFEVGPTFFGKNPGEQQTVVGALKSGVVGRKNWSEKSRKIDLFDIKGDTIRTLVELGLEEENLYINNITKSCYHPGRSGSIKLKSENGPHLAYFGELHPSIVSNLDFKEKNIFGLEIFLKNIPQPNKKLRVSKKIYVVSDFQKSERDFAFIIDKLYNVGDLELVIKKVDLDIIKNVITFDIFEGQNIPEGKKSVAINVTIQATDKTLNENDLDQISQKIIETVKEKTGAIIRS
jgi:phenylalanyl-tRNA synthetase beta chain